MKGKSKRTFRPLTSSHFLLFHHTRFSFLMLELCRGVIPLLLPDSCLFRKSNHFSLLILCKNCAENRADLSNAQKIQKCLTNCQKQDIML